MLDADPKVVSVASYPVHEFTKEIRTRILLLAGHGVEGDAHCGVTVKHRSRVAVDPNQPNLRQVHLIAVELLSELSAKRFDVQPGNLGENILTSGIDLIGLPVRTRLHIGSHALVEITGLRNPCRQIDDFRPGLLRELIAADENGNLLLRAGIMGVVIVGGVIQSGDPITVSLPPKPYRKLERV